MMKQHNDTGKIISAVLAFIAFTTLLILSLCDHNAHDQVHSIYYICSVAGIIVITILSLLFRKEKVRITLTDVLVLLYFVYLTINYLFVSQVDVSTKYLNTGFLFLLYCSFRVLLTEGSTITKLLLIVLLVLGIAESALGLAQWTGVTHSGHDFLITGTFSNPGPYGGFLAIVIAVCASYMIQRIKGIEKSIWLYVLCVPTIFLAILIIIVILNLAALVAGSASVILCLFNNKKIREKIKHYFSNYRRSTIGLCTVILFAVTFVSYATFYQKRDSAIGRLFVWRTSCSVILEHPIFGCGYGSFGGTFAKAQAKYFQNHPDSWSKTVADAPNYSFNEYLQSTAETGLVGVTFLLRILLIALHRLIKIRHFFGYGLVAIMIFALFSYPFSIPALQIPVVLSVATGATQSKVLCSIKKNPYILGFTTLLATVIYITPLYFKKIQATQAWDNAAILYQLRYYEQAVCDYSELYPVLKDNPIFLLEYGHTCYQVKEYEQSNVILQEGVRLSSDPMFYHIIGANYKGLGDVGLAEKSYLFAFDVVPNRITPLYLLMKLYAETGQEQKSLEMAQRVIDFDPKVNSHIVEGMKQEAKEMMQ
jgi:O-antigen ligase